MKELVLEQAGANFNKGIKQSVKLINFNDWYRPPVIFTSGLLNSALQDKSGPWSLFVNKVIVGHSLAHSFMYCLWLLFFFFFFFLFFYFFWLCWVLVSAQGPSPVAASGGHSSLWCTGLSLSWPLLLWSPGSRRAGSVVVAHGPTCSTAGGILPDQGSNPCPLHWQADSQPLHHQGSPSNLIQRTTGNLARAIRKDKEIKVIQIRKVRVKLLFAYMILCIENHKG